MLLRRSSTLASALALLVTLAVAFHPEPLVAQDSVPAIAPAPAAEPAVQIAPAQQAGAAAVATGDVQAADIDSLLARVAARFQLHALPRRDGVLLLPKYEAPDVQSVQIAGGTISINGRPAAGDEIQSLLGEDAPLVLRLSYLPPAQLAERVAAGVPADTTVGPPATAGVIARADTAGAEDDEMDDEDAATEDEFDPDPDVDIDLDFQGGDIVRMGGDVSVAEGETVGGDLVSIGGNVDVAGTVLGDAVSIGGVLRLHETAQVNGDAVSVGGRLERAPGARVLGKVSSVGIAVPFLTHRSFMWDGGGMFGPVGGFFVTLLWIALLLVLGSIFILFAGRPLDRVETNVRTSPLKAGVVGFLAQVLFLPVYVIGLLLLVITIIGIPIAVLWAVGFFLVGFVAALFGFTAVARAVGHAVSNRLDRPLYSPYVALFLGLIILFAPNLLGNLFSFGPGLMDVFGMVFSVLGFLITYLAFTVGFGSVILTRFGTRASWSGEPPAERGIPAGPVSPAPPPAPAGDPFPVPAYRSLPEPPSGRLVEGGAAGTTVASLEETETRRLGDPFDEPVEGPSGGSPFRPRERNDEPPPV